MDQPIFWIQKLDKEGQSEELHDEYAVQLPELVSDSEDSSEEENFTDSTNLLSN